jgi:hypothetical protein
MFRAILPTNHKRTKSRREADNALSNWVWDGFADRSAVYRGVVHGVLAAIATVVAAAFTAALADRWVARRKPHELAWMISLAMFTVASFALWLGAAHQWNGFSFRLFYLFGAIANVPWLALGSILLLTNGRHATRWLTWLAVATAFAAGVVVVAPSKAIAAPKELPEGRELFGVLPRVLAAAASGLAATVIVVLALWSAWRLLRRRRVSAGSVGNRALAFGNIVIALGTIVLSASGTLAGRVGEQEAFAITLVIGVVVLFAGFAIATGSPGMATRSSRDRAHDLLAAAAG